MSDVAAERAALDELDARPRTTIAGRRQLDDGEPAERGRDLPQAPEDPSGRIAPDDRPGPIAARRWTVGSPARRPADRGRPGVGERVPAGDRDRAGTGSLEATRVGLRDERVVDQARERRVDRGPGLRRHPTRRRSGRSSSRTVDLRVTRDRVDIEVGALRDDLGRDREVEPGVLAQDRGGLVGVAPAPRRGPARRRRRRPGRRPACS